jgi:hypothetical protein
MTLPEDQRMWCRVCGRRKRAIATGRWTVRYVCDDPHYLPILPEPLSPLPEPEIPATDRYAAWAAMQADREQQFLRDADNETVPILNPSRY